MKIVDHILELKHCEMWTIDPDDSAQNALNLMLEKNVGAVLVVRDERLKGMLTESDYVQKVIGKSLDPDRTRVSEVMTHNVTTATTTTTIEECMQMMTRGQLRHLPVLIGDDLVGLISINDIVSALLGAR